MRDSRLVQNGTQNQFGEECVVFFCSKTIKFFSFFVAEFKRAEVERYDINTLASTISVIVSEENTGIFDMSYIDTHPYLLMLCFTLVRIYIYEIVSIGWQFWHGMLWDDSAAFGEIEAPRFQWPNYREERVEGTCLSPQLHPTIPI